MNNLKILLVGANGQLGKEFQSVLNKMRSDIGEIPNNYKNAKVDVIDYPELDVTDRKAVFEKISGGYDFVINCSAYTAVDKAEDDFEACYKVNTIGPFNLACACKEYDSTLIHFSTDYVFGGDGKEPYNEYDVCLPKTVYGKTKIEGEKYIRENCNKYFIFRTAWLYGEFANNFVYKMIELSKTKPFLTVVDDQKGTPTNANDLVHVVLNVILTEEYGLYHATGEGECTWYDFTKKIFEYSGIVTEVKPVKSEEFKSRAERPKYSVLNNLHLKSINKNYMRAWEVALLNFIEKVKK